MIIGTLALIMMLFGGIQDYYLIDTIEKGIKEHVIEKDRKKEILAEIKIEKKNLKSLKKSRSSLVKELNKLNSDRSSSKDDFKVYQESFIKNNNEYQGKVISTRLRLIEKITDDEWELIIGLSTEKEQKEKDKTLKKGEKNAEKNKTKNKFSDLEKVINESITDAQKKIKVMESFHEYMNSMKALEDKISQKNVIDAPIIRDKYSTKEDLQKIGNELNLLRINVFNNMVDFHFDILKNTDQKEWDKIMKAFVKTWE